jgi:hypothetical protein
MDRFEYKVLRYKTHGLLSAAWFDGDEVVGNEIDAELLNRYGTDGWEVCAFMHMILIILKRRVAM